MAAYVITTEAGQSYTDLATYGITAVNRTSLLLNVKGCDNAHIGIYQNGGVRQTMVEFVLGARMNDGYDIREYVNGASPVYKVSKKGVLLDCNEFRAFWISWGLTPAGHRSWLVTRFSLTSSRTSRTHSQTMVIGFLSGSHPIFIVHCNGSFI